MYPTATEVPTLPITSRIRTLAIDRHLNGPRRAANGGFAAGAIARTVDADTVTVTLHGRVPLGTRLTATDMGAGAVVVTKGARRIATAHPGELSDHPLPDPTPTLTDAFLARDAHPLYGVRHLLSACVVCGPDRRDGMHVTPGPVPGRPHLLAAPWVVAPNVSTHGAAVFSAVWAALDCPSYPAAALHDAVFCLLGTMTARVDRRPGVGERVVVYSWTREQVGRRYETSAATVDTGRDHRPGGRHVDRRPSPAPRGPPGRTALSTTTTPSRSARPCRIGQPEDVWWRRTLTPPARVARPPHRTPRRRTTGTQRRRDRAG